MLTLTAADTATLERAAAWHDVTVPQIALDEIVRIAEAVVGASRTMDESMATISDRDRDRR